MDDAHEWKAMLLTGWGWLEAWEYHASCLSLRTLAGHLLLELEVAVLLDCNAQCAPTMCILILMLLEMLVTESRMVVHVTVLAIEALIFGKPSIKI